jgi:hypothetical protein
MRFIARTSFRLDVRAGKAVSNRKGRFTDRVVAKTRSNCRLLMV